jgi:hypothetical protein
VHCFRWWNAHGLFFEQREQRIVKQWRWRKWWKWWSYDVQQRKQQWTIWNVGPADGWRRLYLFDGFRKEQ